MVKKHSQGWPASSVLINKHIKTPKYYSLGTPKFMLVFLHCYLLWFTESLSDQHMVKINIFQATPHL